MPVGWKSTAIITITATAMITVMITATAIHMTTIMIITIILIRTRIIRWGLNPCESILKTNGLCVPT
ncbi:precorrin-8X methylmutase [Rhodobacterales bacterium HTCC2150]|nr:precorrin-8X methylmutase [Rhodobacterales bacterium HTCC2150] [Rhodobacteraceae bacterium HTCC2150]